MVNPEITKIIVFANGTPAGSIVGKPIGGHWPPIQIDGDKLAEKKAQKNAKKNITSEAMNNNIPYLNPCWTLFEWTRNTTASLTMSEHHEYTTAIKNINPNKNTNKPDL